MLIEYHSTSPNATERLAQELSLWAKPGQCILLAGDLGAGKSTFARAFIRALALNEKDFDVPSPTFSLVQTYENLRVPVAHIDLYRLNSADEVESLGLSELVSSHILLIEWPEKMPASLSPDSLKISLSGHGENREIILQASGGWTTSLQRNALINDFVKQSSINDGARRFLEGDASSRRYEKIVGPTKTLLLMDMPARPDGPIVRDNRTYSSIAHLAEGIGPVVAINDYLGGLGYSAPEVHDADIRSGLAFIEDLGSNVFDKMIARGVDMREPLQAAVDVLADMAVRIWPNSIPLRGGPAHHVRPYDHAAMLIEVDLLPSWYWPHMKQTALQHDVNAGFKSIWQELLTKIPAENPVWNLRDFHSPNLLWLPERQGLRRIGIIDSQDCVMGHPAYDLVSMLQDARIDIDFQITDGLFEYYCSLREKSGNFDVREFTRSYAILGAQRATKILGIFARLFKRDGKPAYLKHMPRVKRHLARNLSHPDLHHLKAWYDQNLPLDN